jgi:hypothetical protein
LTAGESATFVKIKDMTKVTGLELIESIMSSFPSLIRQQTSLLTLVKEKVGPMLIKSFSDKLEYALTVRLLRLSLAFIKHFHDIMTMETEILLSMFAKTLQSETASFWHKIITLETFKNICTDGPLQRSLFLLFDEKENAATVLKDVAHSICELLFEEKKGLLSGVYHAGSPEQMKDLKEGQSVQPDYAVVWSSSLIKVPW